LIYFHAKIINKMAKKRKRHENAKKLQKKHVQSIKNMKITKKKKQKTT